MKYLLLSLALIGCSPTARQTQLQYADAISRSVNAIEPTIVEQYRVELRTCRVEASGDSLKYTTCADEVDSRWEHFRDAWTHMMHVQAIYAKALENKEPRLQDFAEWVQLSYCQLKTVAPEGVKLPNVPGVECKDGR